MATLPTIPETITVHLGAPSAYAENITIPFTDYIKNVASSEIFPTWPESALRANIYAQTSFALNRVFTEWYRAQGYDFDITNSTRFDQSFVPGRDIFENISTIVDEQFNSYVVREGAIEPLFTQYCNGTTTTCDGLSQWGTVSLAEQGLSPEQILQRFYGTNISIVQNAPVSAASGGSWPGVSYRLGDVSEEITVLQRRLNRIAVNYPNIPKIDPIDGIYDQETERSVITFQRQFNLTPDGIAGKSTWYRIAFVYASVLRLSELDSEGLTLEDVSRQYPEALEEGMSGTIVRLLQYFLAVVGAYYDEIPVITPDGFFGPKTREAVAAYQALLSLPTTGTVDRATWDALTSTYQSVQRVDPYLPGAVGLEAFPGRFLVEGIRSEDVRQIQQDLNVIASVDGAIPSVTEDGVFGRQTFDAVAAFQRSRDLPETGAVGPLTWDEITREAAAIRTSQQTTPEQYPGYAVGA